MVHENRCVATKNRALMIRYRSHKLMSLEEFDWPFQPAQEKNNRWVKLSDCIPGMIVQRGITNACQTPRVSFSFSKKLFDDLGGLIFSFRASCSNSFLSSGPSFVGVHTVTRIS